MGTNAIFVRLCSDGVDHERRVPPPHLPHQQPQHGRVRAIALLIVQPSLATGRGLTLACAGSADPLHRQRALYRYEEMLLARAAHVASELVNQVSYLQFFEGATEVRLVRSPSSCAAVSPALAVGTRASVRCTLG